MKFPCGRLRIGKLRNSTQAAEHSTEITGQIHTHLLAFPKRPAIILACSTYVPGRSLFRSAAIEHVMTKSRRQELSEHFTEQWQRCRDWLLPFMQNGQPKLLTKDKLRSAAMRELKVSKNAFDFSWMAAIEDAG